MMIEKLLKDIRGVTDNYTTIEAEFTTNSVAYGEPIEEKGKVKVKWKLYIADITTKTGNAFPTFDTFSQLESFVNILILELRRVHTDSIKNAVQNAIDILIKETQ